MGERGSSSMDREATMAMGVFVNLLMCHCFMWFVEFGGSVIVE